MDEPSVGLRTPFGTLVSLADPSQRDVERVARLLGADRASADPSFEPDIRVTFERERPSDPAAAIAWSSMDDRVWELRAERDSGRVLHLKPLVRLSALAKGALPLHAAAAVDPEGGASLLAGPAGSGKTRLLLALLEQGWALLAGEWIVVRSHQVMSVGETIDLRASHLRDLGSLHPRLSPTDKVRQAVARLPAARRLDRFELAADQLGARSMPAGAHVPIARVLWCVSGVEQPNIRTSHLDSVLDELVKSQLWRYADVLGLHERAVDAGAAPSPVLSTLGELFRRRMIENLAGLRVDVIEHSPQLPLSDVGLLAAGVGAGVG